MFYEEISEELIEACGCPMNHDCDIESEDGNVGKVKKLLSSGLVDVNCLDGELELTPLHAAAVFGHTGIVGALLDEGANPNKAATSGEIPLHKAVRYGHKDVVQILLDSGADINKKGGCWDETPLHYAAGSYYGDPEMVQLLINGGAEVNSTSGFHGWTPYDKADERDYRHPRILDNLGRDYEIPNEERRHRHSETLAVLRKNGGLSSTDLP